MVQTNQIDHEQLQELIPSEIPDDTMELVPVRNRVRKWAAENAYLLIYLTLISAIGWAVTIATH